MLLETVRRFKGLERPVVILTAIDDLRAEEETAILYCGLSRARAHLIIVATEQTMASVLAGGRSGSSRVDGARLTPMQAVFERPGTGAGHV